ncbi:DotA/TraY family protein [Thiotrichales bacterium 19X7-9]|nr:DotA/TraY family protein [Thiotrichales bacterium 19X7-9]
MSSTIWGTVPAGDASQKVLNTVFGGDVQTLLTSINPTLFSTTFKYFNAGLLAVVFIIYAFVILVGTVNTARDGQFLGKNWSGHWISLRAIFGTVFAVPLSTGYCVAQYLIFAMVTAGVSFADYVWEKVVGDVITNNVPPVVSSEVSNNIDTYLATFMMSNLTRNMLGNDTFVKPEGSSGNAPCIKANDTLPVKVKVPQSTYDANDNVTETSYTTETFQVYPISCDISFSTDINNSFVQSYAEPLATAVQLNSDGSINSSVKPFDSYTSILNQGLSSWSQVEGSNDQYIQYKLDTADWIGKLNINQMVNQPKPKDITPIAREYDLSNYRYLIINLVDDPDEILDPKYSNAINDTSTQIIKKLEEYSGSITEECDYSDDTNICYKAKNYGWWDADTLYLDLDNSLSQNLQNLYANFAKLSNAANLVSNQTTILIDYQFLNVHYIRVENGIDNLIKNSESFDPTDDSNYQYEAQVNLEPFQDQIAEDNSFTTSMSAVRDLFNQIISDSSLSDSDKSLYQQQVNNLLTDGMQFQYAQYLYIDYSLVSSVYSPYVDSSVSDSEKQTEANKLFNKAVLPIINLFTFFSSNDIDFGGSEASVNTSNVTDQAQELLTEIFNSLGTNDNSAAAGGLLQQIYDIGCVNGDCSGDSDYTNDEGGTDFAAQNFSMIQNVQAVGMALIEGTINSMMGIFSHAKDQLQEIQNSAQKKFKKDKKKSEEYAGWNAATGGLYSSTFAAQSGLDYAQSMFQVTMKLAEFSLSLMWLPLVLFVLTSIFSIGISFSIIIPLTPYILFWAGKTAWLLLVIEAMAAAPVVALGLVYPEGHEVFGKAEPGIQICMNLVLRPVFMILGMIFGIGLTYVVIQYSADGFHAITDSLLDLMPASNGTDAASYARGVFSCMIIFLYATFLSMAFMKCFSLIYVIPDKVLQWIGNTRGERAGEAEIQEFKGAGMQYAQSAAQAGGQTMTQGIEAEKSKTSSYAQGKRETSQATSQRNLAISNDSTNAAKQAGEAALMM